MRGLLKTAHSYDKRVRLRELQDPLFRQARKKSRQLTLPIYGTGSKYVDIGVQTKESDLALDYDEN
jgi:hypothetical protein